MIDQCKLCLNNKELRNSHIIPNFIFRQLKKTDRQVVWQAKEDAEPTVGFYDKTYSEYMLCNDCEAVIKKYEDHARDIIFTDSKSEITRNVTKGKIYYKNIDYLLFKNFELSVLWRASVSNQTMFNKINIPPDDQESLRTIIYQNLHSDPSFYCCDVINFYDSYDRIRDTTKFIFQPFTSSEPILRYIFVYGSFIWSYYPNSELVPAEIKSRMLTEGIKYSIFRKDMWQYSFFKTPLSYSTIANRVGKLAKEK